MKNQNIWYCIIFVSLTCIVGLSSTSAQTSSFTFDHQDPAGDVLIYNATENGTPVTNSFYEPLDIKWLYSEKDGLGNVLLTMDLKSKNKFFNRDDTKYVVRIITTPDNSTGYNITYINQSTILKPFSLAGNGTSVDFSTNVSFNHEKGDEMMVVRVRISTYLSDTEHYWLDAYSMMNATNATYLDYISELPGHPEYVNPEVEKSENLENGKVNNDDKNDNGGNSIIIGAVTGIIIIISLLIVILIWFAKKSKRNR
jgi:hypothetical protein